MVQPWVVNNKKKHLFEWNGLTDANSIVLYHSFYLIFAFYFYLFYHVLWGGKIAEW